MAKTIGDEATREFSFQVIGHTDRHGTEDYNQKLSERRAQAVVANWPGCNRGWASACNQ